MADSKTQKQERLYTAVLEAFKKRGYTPLSETAMDMTKFRYRDNKGGGGVLNFDNYYRMLETQSHEVVLNRLLRATEENRDGGLIDLRNHMDKITFRPRILDQSIDYFRMGGNSRTSSKSVIMIALTDTLHLSCVIDLPDSFRAIHKWTVDQSELNVAAVIHAAFTNTKK